MMKRLVWTLAALMLVCANLMAQRPNREPSRIVVAYVTSNPTVMPDPSRMTHINYAFGHVNDTFNGVRINNESRLHSITALKKDAPWLKVCLSIGGWGSGRFSEMAATDENRKAFAADCARVVAEFDLDGIDLLMLLARIEVLAVCILQSTTRITISWRLCIINTRKLSGFHSCYIMPARWISTQR